MLISRPGKSACNPCIPMSVLLQTDVLVECPHWNASLSHPLNDKMDRDSSFDTETLSTLFHHILNSVLWLTSFTLPEVDIPIQPAIWNQCWYSNPWWPLWCPIALEVCHSESGHFSCMCACSGAFRWLGGKESTCQCRKHRRLRLDPWVGKMPWRRKWQLTPVFLAGKSHGQKSLVGYSPWGCKTVGLCWYSIIIHGDHSVLKPLRSVIQNLAILILPFIFVSLAKQKFLESRNSYLHFIRNPPQCTFAHGSVQFSSVQSLSRVWLFVTPWITACQASLSITNSRSWLKLMSIESVMPSSHLILCRPLLLLPTFPPSIRVFSNESTLHIW